MYSLFELKGMALFPKKPFKSFIAFVPAVSPSKIATLGHSFWINSKVALKKPSRWLVPPKSKNLVSFDFSMSNSSGTSLYRLGKFSIIFKKYFLSVCPFYIDSFEY